MKAAIEPLPQATFRGQTRRIVSELASLQGIAICNYSLSCAHRERPTLACHLFADSSPASIPKPNRVTGFREARRALRKMLGCPKLFAERPEHRPDARRLRFRNLDQPSIAAFLGKQHEQTPHGFSIAQLAWLTAPNGKSRKSCSCQSRSPPAAIRLRTTAAVIDALALAFPRFILSESAPPPVLSSCVPEKLVASSACGF